MKLKWILGWTGLVTGLVALLWLGLALVALIIWFVYNYFGGLGGLSS